MELRDPFDREPREAELRTWNVKTKKERLIIRFWTLFKESNEFH